MDNPRTIIHALLRLIEVKSAAARPLADLCTACYGKKPHRAGPRVQRPCDCVCHRARLWLDADAEDPTPVTSDDDASIVDAESEEESDANVRSVQE